MRKQRIKYLFLLAGIAVTACSTAEVDYRYPEKIKGKYEMPSAQTKAEKQDTVFDKSHLTFTLGGEKQTPVPPAHKTPAPVTASSSFLWQAAVSVLSDYYPLSSANRAEGVIVTEWYNSQTPLEQLKATAVVFPESTETSGLKIIVFRRVLDSSGDWQEGGIEASIADLLESAILAKRKQLQKAAETN